MASQNTKSSGSQEGESTADVLEAWLLGAGPCTQYLDTLDAGLAHAAAPVDEEDKLPMCLPQAGLHRLEVRTEVEHND